MPTDQLACEEKVKTFVKRWVWPALLCGILWPVLSVGCGVPTPTPCSDVGDCLGGQQCVAQVCVNEDEIAEPANDGGTKPHKKPELPSPDRRPTDQSNIQDLNTGNDPSRPDIDRPTPDKPTVDQPDRTLPEPSTDQSSSESSADTRVKDTALSERSQDKTGSPDRQIAPDTHPRDNAPPDSGPPPIKALALTSFVYAKEARVGASHLYVYDITSKTHKLLSKLDDRGSGAGTRNPSFSISPDRKWIAFNAFFRPSKGDFAHGLATPAIWLISADGKQFRRVSTPLPPTSHTSCQSDSQCGSQVCNTVSKRCMLPGYRVTIGTPRWSSDGKTIWSVMGQYWTKQGKLTGGSQPVSVPATGGAFRIHTLATTCAQVTHVSPSPTTKSLLAVHSVCTKGTDTGVFSYTTPPQTGKLVFNRQGFDVSLETPQWIAKGPKAVIKATTSWDTTGDGKGDTYGEGLIILDTSKKNGDKAQIGPLLQPFKNKNMSYQDFTLSANGNYMVVCIYDNQSNKRDLLYVDSTNQANPVQTLTTDGISCRPAW